MTLARTTLAALLLAAPAVAQDLVGFDAASFGEVVLKRNQLASDTIPEAAFGAYNNEFINTYSPQSVFARIGRSVGRLDVGTDAGVFPCTAFLVGDDLIMTNHHCVPGILDDPRTDATAITGVQFVMGYTQEGVTEGARRYTVDPEPVETSQPLDYTLLRIRDEAPGRDFGTLQLASAAPHDNDPYWIIGHPMGEAQRISREKCRANAPALSGGQLLHTCDTMPGNSGSPVIDATSRQVIGLHHAGSARNSINYAIPMSLILAASQVLSPAESPDAGLPTEETDALTRLSVALGLTDIDDRRAALESLVAGSPETAAARTATQLLAALAPPEINPAPGPTLAERMANTAAVQDCDRYAGDGFHPDRRSGLMIQDGIRFEEIDPEQAIAACQEALDAFPDQPRMTAFLAEALTAAGRYQEAFETYGKAASLGDVIGQAGLGIAYLHGIGTEVSHDKALDWLSKSAAQGYPIGQTGLAVMYQMGHGVEVSPDKALALYRQAAEQGYHGAQDQLGDLYRQGALVETSEKTAADWYERAAEQGNSDAQYQLALIYSGDDTDLRDEVRAIHWARAAADQGAPEAMRLLGNLHFQGIGFEKSAVEAARWFRKAADAGDTMSLGNLAWMHEAGRGVARDPERAAVLYIVALRAGAEWPVVRPAADWDPDTARALQRKLAEAGVYSGPVQGSIGPNTQEAMRGLRP